MTEEIFKDLCLCGETTKVQFKQAFTSQKEIAKEMIAFANSKGDNALHYRGIGSGIVRILAECPNLDIVNDSDGNEFKVTIFRGVLDTIQKDDFTIQKTDFATQKNETTTQKDETTTQKNKTTTQKDEITTQKKILDFLKINPKATRVEIAQALGDITADGVKFIIAKLQQKGLLKRVGGRKHGEWVVCHDEKNTK